MSEFSLASPGIVTEADFKFPYTLFAIGDTVYGIDSRYVVSIEILGKTNTIHGASDFVRSGVLYRGNFIELINTRVMFGLGNQLEEFERKLDPQRRIQEHISWVDELELSVRERREFRLTDDPHKCAFGKWYDDFDTDNITLKHTISQINAPHQAVHNAAKLVKTLMQRRAYDEALAAVQEVRVTHVKNVVDLIGTLVKTMEQNLRELYIVIQTPTKLKGIIVDAVIGVETLNLLERELPQSLKHAEYFSSIYQRPKEKTSVLVLDANVL